MMNSGGLLFAFTRRLSLPLVAVGLICSLSSDPAFAITNGTPDNANEYPSVGMMILQSPSGDLSRYCSAVLIHERVAHSVAHCTRPIQGLIDAGWHIYVSFDVTASLATAREVSAVYTHPDWRGMFGANSIDIGALVFAEPVTDIETATMPSVDYLTALRNSGSLNGGANATQFTRVGYGFALAWPPPAFIDNTTRRYSSGDYNGLMKQWLSLHANPAQGDGSVCFWDSGGAVFYSDSSGNRVFVGTPTWIDAQCIAMTLNTRTDLQTGHDFINGIIAGLD